MKRAVVACPLSFLQDIPAGDTGDLFVLRLEPSRRVRIAALAAWAAPVVIVTTASVGCGIINTPGRAAVGGRDSQIGAPRARQT